MRLSIVSLTKGMEFVGDVVSKRQHYFVLRATSVYYVLSMSNTKVNSGNFNLVSKRAVDYLLKPVRRERLEKAIDKARKLHKPAPKPAAKKIAGRKGPDIYLLDPADIIAFQAEGELVHILTGNQKYLAEAPLKALEHEPALAAFRRVHRSTLINTDHIRKISPLSSRRWLLQLSNGFEAIVSKRLASTIR